MDSPEMRALMDTASRAAISRRLRAEAVEPGAASNYANMVDAARKLHRVGVVLGLGTDTSFPDGVHYELEELVAASLSPLDAIASATSVAARIIGASDQIGRLASGFFADLVILDGDPTNDISNTRRIWRVVQGGRVVDRESLLRNDDNRMPGR